MRRAFTMTAIAVALLAIQVGTHRVVRVVDGDTIIVDYEGRPERVRYIGIDTPETVDPRRPVEVYGKEAAAANRRMVEGRRVRLEFDVERRDRYGRLLAYVWVGDTLVNDWLVRNGYAQVATYPPNVRYVDRFLDSQRAAREAGRGLWGTGDADPDTAAGRSGGPEGRARDCCKVCRKGKACGDSCISRRYTCHSPPGCACDG